VEHDHMVQALAPNRTNEALDVGPLAGGSRGAQHFLDAHLSHLSPEGIAENGVAIAQQVARELVKGKSFTQLLSRPFRRRMRGHVEVDNATPVMGQHQKRVKNLETDGRHGKEVDGDQLLQVILLGEGVVARASVMRASPHGIEKRGRHHSPPPKARDSGLDVKRQWRSKSSLFLTNLLRCG
jgi:hypothetical protein